MGKPIHLVEGSIDSEGFDLDTDTATIVRWVQGGKIVILRGLFANEDAKKARQNIFEWASAQEPFPPGKSASQESINFHRIDNGSANSSIPHLFHQFGFGDIAELPNALGRQLAHLKRTLIDLQNRVAETNFSATTPQFRLKALQHPRGGGFLAPHTHPYLPQRMSVFLNCSEPGVDYQQGAARFVVDGEWIDTHRELRLGDIALFRHDLVHDISPVDPDHEVDWSNDDGFWIISPELATEHLRSSASK